MDRIPSPAGAGSLMTLVLLLGQPVAGHAQDGGDGFLFETPRLSVGLKLGYALPSANGDLFDFTTEQLTLERSDFNAPVIGGEVAVRSTDRIDATLYVGYAGGNIRSEFRDWVDSEDLPIEQVSEFSRTSITAGGRFYLTPRDRTIGRFAWIPSPWAPYLGISGGLLWYRFEQHGDFVDFDTLEIFSDRFRTSGTTFTAQLAAGIDLSLGTRIVLNTEGRYAWGRADTTGDFVGFGPMDLSGFQLTVGIGARL